MAAAGSPFPDHVGPFGVVGTTTGVFVSLPFPRGEFQWCSGQIVIEMGPGSGQFLGLDIRWVTSPLAAFFLNSLGCATGNFLRLFKQSWNFVLVAEKK